VSDHHLAIAPDKGNHLMDIQAGRSPFQANFSAGLSIPVARQDNLVIR
jgi:hypothetical protein